MTQKRPMRIRAKRIKGNKMYFRMFMASSNFGGMILCARAFVNNYFRATRKKNLDKTNGS